MYQISTIIEEQEFNGLQAARILGDDSLEVITISLEKGNEFIERTSPRDTLLIVLEGAVEFSYKPSSGNKKRFLIQKQQTFNFPAEVLHSVAAKLDSKFLIIR